MKDGLHSRTSSSSRSRVEEINFRDVPRVDIESACSRLLAPSRGAVPTGCAGILSWFHHPLDMCSWDETKVPNQNIQAETKRLIWPVEHQKGKLIINCDYLRGVFRNVWTEEGRRLKSVHTQGSVHLSLLWIHTFSSLCSVCSAFSPVLTFIPGFYHPISFFSFHLNPPPPFPRSR